MKKLIIASNCSPNIKLITVLVLWYLYIIICFVYVVKQIKLTKKVRNEIIDKDKLLNRVIFFSRGWAIIIIILLIYGSYWLLLLSYIGIFGGIDFGPY